MAWCTDYVAEQAQSAPLLDNMSETTTGKRHLLDNDHETHAKRKKRESLLKFAASSQDQSCTSQTRGKDMYVATPGRSRGSLFTVCSLCDLQFKTELELEEHLYSLLHHRALDTEKGKDFTHECNLCCKKCRGLSKYVSHLREEVHRKNVERRKEDLDNNRRSGPVFGLIKYRDTFMCQPKKSLHLKDPTPQSLTKASAPEENKRPASSQGHLQTTPTYEPYSDHQHFNFPVDGYRQERPHSNNYRSAHPCNYRNKDNELSSGFLPTKSRQSPRGSEFHQRYSSAPGYPVGEWNPSSRAAEGHHPHWSQRSWESDDTSWYRNNGFYFSHPNPTDPSQEQTPVFPDRRVDRNTEDFEEEAPVISDSIYSAKIRKLSDNLKPNKLSHNRYKSPLTWNESGSALQKWKQVLQQNKATQDQRKDDVSGLRGNLFSNRDNNNNSTSTGRKPLSVQDLYVSGLQKKTGVAQKFGNRQKFGDFTPKNIAPNTMNSKNPVPGIPLNKIQISAKPTSGIKNYPDHAGQEQTNPSKLHDNFTSLNTKYASQRLKDLVTAKSKSENSSRSSSCVSLGAEETELLRKKFRSIMEDIEAPSSCRSASVTTCSSSSTSNQSSSHSKPNSITTHTKGDHEQFGPRVVLFEPHAKQTNIKTSTASETSFNGHLCDSHLVGNLEENELVCENVKSLVGVVGKVESLEVDSSTAKSDQQSSSTDVNALEYDCHKNATKVRNKLLKLAKKKEVEQKQNNLDLYASSVELDGNSCNSAETSKKMDDPEENNETGDNEEANHSENSKRKVTPKPNISKARSRLKVSQHQASNSDSDSDKKQARLAKLLLKLGGRTKLTSADLNQSPKKQSKRKITGPRFGIGLAAKDNDQSYLSLDESDLKDIVSSIKQAEDLHEIPSSSSSKRVRSLSAGENSYEETPPAQLRTTVSVDIDQTPSTPALDGDLRGDLSTQLLHMSEREELLHKQSNEIKQKSDKLNDEITHVNHLIDQLTSRKKELEEEAEKISEEGKKINSDLEDIRQKRLSMLRGSVGGSNLSSAAEPINRTPQSFRPDSCTHSTPTPTSKPDVTMTPVWVSPSPHTLGQKSPTFPDSQSTIRDPSAAKLNSHEESRYDTAVTGIQFDVSDNISNEIDLPLKITNVKSEVETQKHENQLPSQTEPFPVASGSVYFDANNETTEMCSSIDNILKKYLKDASNEREVTSSTTPKKTRRAVKSKAKPQSSDSEVTSTTPHRNVSDRRAAELVDNDDIPTLVPRNRHKRSENTKHTRKRKTKIPSDPHLARLSLQQPDSSDITKSWVTAHDGTFASPPYKSKKESIPVDLTPGEAANAMLQAMTLELHSSAIICVHVTECNKIITCSKDKLVSIVDGMTGHLIKSYKLPNIPITAFAVSQSNWSETERNKYSNVSLFIVFVDDTVERSMLTESSLHHIQIGINISPKNSRVYCNFQIKKLVDYNSCMLCIHQHNDLLYLGARDGRVVIFCNKTLQIKEILDCHSPHAICCVTTGTDGARRILCCGSSDCRVSVRDADDGLLLRTLSGHTKTVNCLQLVNSLLYSGASDRTILVHDIHTGELVHRFLGMHGGSVKSLHIYDKTLVSLCLDKSVRVLRTEPCRVSGPPKSIVSLPLNMHVHLLPLNDEYSDSGIEVPYVYVGCQDGKLQIVPLTQMARAHRKKQQVTADEATLGHNVEQMHELSDLDIVDLVNDLQCLWSGCGATGFTNSSALLTHINLFHATESYKEELNSCCLWDNCTHYFSSDLDTALDVHLHMDKHVHDIVSNAKNQG